MSSVFTRIVAFCEQHHKCIVSQEKRSEIGERVKKRWYKTCDDRLPTNFIDQIEPDGMAYCVIDYPSYFTPFIDEEVEKFYADMRANRKKIPLKPNETFTKLYKAS